ncbi:MAG: M20/M25/M40 family metallo-hydrolase [Chloroflexota bacterium]
MQLSELSQWIAAQKPMAEDALKTLVEINTYTTNHDGVDDGMDMLSSLAEDMGFTVETIHARHRLIKAGNGTGKRVMLITHMDTVHPMDEGFVDYEPLEDGIVRGPGIGDIKGGTVIGLWAMKAISELCEDFDLRMIVSADEEIGSPTIREWYWNRNAHKADYAIGLEPGFPQGELTADVDLGVVYQRRGFAAVKFKVFGKTAHSGVSHLGLSAIEAVAHKIVKLQALNDAEKGISVNVGTIKGGTAHNTVAGQVECMVSFRYETQTDGDATKAAVIDIIETPCVHNEGLGISDRSEYEITTFIPPMERTDESQKLVDIVLEEAKLLGQPVVPIARGGGSDANHVSGSGTPAICGMGAPCQGLHTKDEIIHLPMLFERIGLLTRTLYRVIDEQP